MIDASRVEQLGLDVTEAKVYVALLELGPSSVTEITKKAGITRTLGYHVLQKLGWYGLVDQIGRQKKHIQFVAQHPRMLSQFVVQKKLAWDKRVDLAKDMLPELISQYRHQEKPVVRYQEGKEGLKAIFQETLEAKGEILSILDIEGWDTPEYRQWGKQYNHERSARKIHERILILDTYASREWMRYYRGSFRYTQYRWIRREKLKGIKDFGGELNIFDQKVIMAIHQPLPMGVAIESSVLVKVLTALFEMAWSLGEAEDKKGKNNLFKR